MLLCGTVTDPESQDWLAELRIETLVTKACTLNLEAQVQTNKREDRYNMQIHICFFTSQGKQEEKAKQRTVRISIAGT